MAKRFEIIREYWPRNWGEPANEPYAIVYATREEAQKRMAELGAGIDHSFFNPEGDDDSDGGFLFVQEREYAL